MKPNVVYCFIGPKGVGKSYTARKYIEDSDGEVFSLANSLKESLVSLLDGALTREDVFERKEEYFDINGRRIKPRDLMIFYDNFKDLLGTDFYAWLLSKKIKKYLLAIGERDGRFVVCIDDLRLISEYEKLREEFGDSLKVIWCSDYNRPNEWKRTWKDYLSFYVYRLFPRLIAFKVIKLLGLPHISEVEWKWIPWDRACVTYPKRYEDK